MRGLEGRQPFCDHGVPSMEVKVCLHTEDGRAKEREQPAFSGVLDMPCISLQELMVKFPGVLQTCCSSTAIAKNGLIYTHNKIR